MENKTFAERHGFDHDPFESTNSESEELLGDYFVPPPYFATVRGDPEKPSASVVFAPRGSGKTAQRRMIELASLDVEMPFVCITYDRFDTSRGVDLSLEDHLAQLCRLLTVTVLAYLNYKPAESVELSDLQKKIVKLSAELYVGSLSDIEFTAALSAVKSLGDRAGDLWRKYGGVLAAAIGALMSKWGVDGVRLPDQIGATAATPEQSSQYFFQQLVEVVMALGGGSLYILIDKVDETSRSSTDAGAAWRLIKELVTDLPTIGTRSTAFKFFLWDQLEEPFRSDGGRPDRVTTVNLDWTVAELEEMLSKRLLAYSGGRVLSFNDLIDRSISINAHKLLAYLAAGSPRDMIRLAQYVANEHTRVDAPVHKITMEEFDRGIRKFSSDRAQEVAARYFSDFQKVGQPSFTINHLANRVFNVSTESARSKVQKWVSSGAVAKIGELPNKKNKPLHLYGFTDIRIVLATTGVHDLVEVLDNYALECSSCGRVALTAETELACPDCGTTIRLNESRSVWSICATE